MCCSCTGTLRLTHFQVAQFHLQGIIIKVKELNNILLKARRIFPWGKMKAQWAEVGGGILLGDNTHWAPLYMHTQRKGKVHPTTCYEGPERWYRYSSTFSLTSALKEGVVNATPRLVDPRKRPSIHWIAGWYIYIYTHTHTHTHIYIYIYIGDLVYTKCRLAPNSTCTRPPEKLKCYLSGEGVSLSQD